MLFHCNDREKKKIRSFITPKKRVKVMEFGSPLFCD
jgi:hypothetical protein